MEEGKREEEGGGDQMIMPMAIAGEKNKQLRRETTIRAAEVYKRLAILIVVAELHKKHG